MTTFQNPGFAASSWLVAEREIRMKLRSKAFLISTGILMLAVLGSILASGLFGTANSKMHVAATGAAVAVAEQLPNLRVTTVDSVEAARELVRDGTVEAALVPAEDAPTGVQILALDSAPQSLVVALSTPPTVELLDPDALNPLLAYLAAIAFGIVFFMSAMTFGTTIAQSVVEEKQTRIVEILLSTISVRALMAGKVLGNSLLAFAQIAAIAALAAIGLTVTGQAELLASFGPSIAWFVVFFVFGFIMIAALYAATASLVSRQEDVGSATSPVMILVMLPYILVIAFNDNPVVLAIMSYVPFSAPVGMPMRVFLGDAAWWEPLLSLAILLATTAVVIVIGARIYSNALLRTGARVKLSEALAR
ncbi:ABC transporter permease [Leifsonia bigeumensis]|uniref:ABC transporter permease n=1 Tax=Leifsonella bigeumensis TaxID=433643 RepID=A0ABP7F6K2_9MICO